MKRQQIANENAIGKKGRRLKAYNNNNNCNKMQ